jgi:hypothetical protein
MVIFLIHKVAITVHIIMFYYHAVIDCFLDFSIFLRTYFLCFLYANRNIAKIIHFTHWYSIHNIRNILLNIPKHILSVPSHNCHINGYLFQKQYYRFVVIILNVCGSQIEMLSNISINLVHTRNWNNSC